ncbi:recombinase family protein [Natrialba swarupiae]|nr:recombinase family protein [Natrialba swarupiae]
MMDKMMGQMVAWLMEYEAQMIRQRVQSGVTRAIEQGKWVGRPPFGFSTDSDGYLQIEPEEYLAMQSAIEYARENPSQSVNSIARAHDVPQSTLNRVLKDDERAVLYVDGKSNDNRVTTAIDEF